MTMYKWVRITDNHGRTNWKLKATEVKGIKGK